MFDSDKAKTCIKKLFGWKDHHDPSEIPALSAELKESETGEYYQDKHPALRLDIIKQALPPTKDLEEYLTEVEDAAIVEMLNDLTEHKQVKKVGKEILTNDVIIDAVGWKDNLIINDGRFVGIRFKPCMSIGLKERINRLALQLTDPQADLPIYLYHTSQEDPINIFSFSTNKRNSFSWVDYELDLYADDGQLSGGWYYLGYYQDDLVGQAINYDKLNWSNGYCKTCDGGKREKTYRKITKYVLMESFYVPAISLDPSRKLFEPRAAIETDDKNWGFNFNISGLCDLTNFWCDNRRTLRKALSLKVVQKVLEMMTYSQQINFVSEQVYEDIIRELEGNTSTRKRTLPHRYEHALKALNFDHSSINRICLPASVNSRVRYTFE